MRLTTNTITSKMIEVVKIDNDADLNEAYLIREKVYIEEQQIDRQDEFDEFDESSHHFLAKSNGQPAGTGRWRITSNGAKLERFATLPEHRGKGVASRIIQAMIGHIKADFADISYFYLNAQLTAMPLYSKFGFKPVGDEFLECDIPHQKMELIL